jgi:hypothetical protein
VTGSATASGASVRAPASLGVCQWPGAVRLSSGLLRLPGLPVLAVPGPAAQGSLGPCHGGGGISVAARAPGPPPASTVAQAQAGTV